MLTVTVVCSVSECNNDCCVFGVCPVTRSEIFVSTVFDMLQWLLCLHCLTCYSDLCLHCFTCYNDMCLHCLTCYSGVYTV